MNFFSELFGVESKPSNGHGKCAAPDDETRYARFPLPSPLPEGEGDKDSLREFHVNRLGGHIMSNTITLPQAIFKRLEKITAGSRRTPQAIIKQAIADRLEYEEWKLEQIDAGLADIKAGHVLSDDEFWKKIGKPRNERKKTA